MEINETLEKNLTFLKSLHKEINGGEIRHKEIEFIARQHKVNTITSMIVCKRILKRVERGIYRWDNIIPNVKMAEKLALESSEYLRKYNAKNTGGDTTKTDVTKNNVTEPETPKKVGVVKEAARGVVPDTNYVRNDDFYSVSIKKSHIRNILAFIKISVAIGAGFIVGLLTCRL